MLLAMDRLASVCAAFAIVALMILGAACGHDAHFNENFTGGTPTPATLEISAPLSATPQPSA
jgi:hypothetical protein